MLLETDYASGARKLVQPSPSERWVRLAVIVWTVIVTACCVRASLAPRTNDVYVIFTDAARRWVAGEATYLRDDKPYRYAPPITLLFVPLSYLPDQLGGVLWRLLNAAVYLAGLAWWSRVALPLRLTPSQRALLFLLAAPLSIGSINNGQSNPLLLGLLLMAAATVARRRWHGAAFCLALAALLKVYPLAVGLLFVALFPRLLAWRCSLALLIGLALPFAAHDSAYVLTQYEEWCRFLADDDRQDLSLQSDYRNLRGLARVAGLSLSAASFAFLQLGAGLAVLGLCGAAQRSGWSRRHLGWLVLGLGCCWMTVFGSATESCTYILLAPILAWSLLDAWLRPRPALIKALLLGSAALFVFCLVAVWFPGVRNRPALGFHCLAGLLLFAAIVWGAINDLGGRRSLDVDLAPVNERT